MSHACLEQASWVLTFGCGLNVVADRDAAVRGCTRLHPPSPKKSGFVAFTYKSAWAFAGADVALGQFISYC
jgi:ABC-type sulfate transport system substrate-binding protein